MIQCGVLVHDADHVFQRGLERRLVVAHRRVGALLNDLDLGRRAGLLVGIRQGAAGETGQVLDPDKQLIKAVHEAHVTDLRGEDLIQISVALVRVNRSEQALIELGGLHHAVRSRLRPQNIRVNVNGQLGAFILPQDPRILDVRLLNHVDRLGEDRRAHGTVDLDIVCVRDFEPSKKRPARIPDQCLFLQCRPSVDVCKLYLFPQRVLVVRLEGPLRDTHAFPCDRVTLQPCVCRLAFLEHVRDDNVGHVAVVIEGQGIKSPVHGIVEIDVPVLDIGIGLYEHAAGRASLLELEPDDPDQLLKFGLQVFGAGIHDLLAVLTQALACYVPLHLDHDAARDLRADKCGKVERLDILTQPVCFIEIQLIPLIKGVDHICRQRSLDPFRLLDCLIRNHLSKHLPNPCRDG